MCGGKRVSTELHVFAMAENDSGELWKMSSWAFQHSVCFLKPHIDKSRKIVVTKQFRLYLDFRFYTSRNFLLHEWIQACVHVIYVLCCVGIILEQFHFYFCWIYQYTGFLLYWWVCSNTMNICKCHDNERIFQIPLAFNLSFSRILPYLLDYEI